MKVKLLNDGGYEDMEDVGFPVVLDSESITSWEDLVGIPLLLILEIPGIDVGLWGKFSFKSLSWCVGAECEILTEENSNG